MGTFDSSTYTVEYRAEGWSNWYFIEDGFKTESSAITYIKGRALENSVPTNCYRVVPTKKAPPAILNTPVKGDMKEGLTAGKPCLSEIPHAPLVYAARGFEYGHSPGKYERGNYLRPQVDRLADFHRMQFYLDAVFRHGTKLTTEMNRALGCTDCSEVKLKAAAMAQDEESGLSHLCGMLANLMMLVQQAVDAGLIPADPGQPWLKKASGTTTPS